MSNEKLVELIQTDPAHKKQYYNELYENNKGLLYKIAKKYSGYELMDDLLQECYIALAKAAELYTPDHDAKFSTYLVKITNGHLCRYLNSNGVIHISHNKKGLILKYKRLREGYEKEYGTAPPDSLIRMDLNISLSEVEEIKDLYKQIYVDSLDKNIPGADDITLGDTVADPEGDHTENVIRAADRARLREQIDYAVQILSEQEQRAIYEKLDHGTIPKALYWRYEDAKRKLCRDCKHTKAIRAYYEEYLEAICYRHVGVNTYNRTWTSSTERSAFRML